MIKVKFREDLLIFSKWFRRIIRRHFSGQSGFHLEFKNPLKVTTHVITLGNMEVDVVITDGKKSIGIELKERDYDKAISQAIKRRSHYDYFYVALDLPAPVILSILRNHSEALEKGIGFVSTEDDCVVVYSYGRRLQEGKRYVELLETMRDEN